MSSTITALTSGGGIVMAGDTSGQLELKTNNGTTALTITTAQNVGIGTTSPSYALDVRSSVAPAIRLSRSGTAGQIASVVFEDGESTLGSGSTTRIASDAGAMSFSTGGTSGAVTGGTERMRIDSSGNALIGQTALSGTERIGVTKSVAGGWVGYFSNSSNTSGDGGIRSAIGSNCNNTSSYHFNGLTVGVQNWYLYGNGTSSFSSDSRLKKNIETTRDGYLDDVMKLRVVKYNWKNDSEGTPRELGLIAQEVEQVFAGLVKDDQNKISEDDDTVYKQLKASVIPMILLKAIQELNAKVDAQALEIVALKGNI